MYIALVELKKAHSLMSSNKFIISTKVKKKLVSKRYLYRWFQPKKQITYYLIFSPYNNRPHLRYFQQTSFGLLWSPTCADHDWWSQSSLEGGPWTAKETRNVIIPSHPLSPNLSIRKQQRLLSYSYYISTIPKIYLLIS